MTANGAAPSAVAAGCVYEAFVAAQWEAKRSQPDVADVAGVSGYTVRRHWHRIQEAGIDGGQAALLLTSAKVARESQIGTIPTTPG